LVPLAKVTVTNDTDPSSSSYFSSNNNLGIVHVQKQEYHQAHHCFRRTLQSIQTFLRDGRNQTDVGGERTTTTNPYATLNNHNESYITEEEMKVRMIGYATFSTTTMMIASTSSFQENDMIQPIWFIEDLNPTIMSDTLDETMTTLHSVASIDNSQQVFERNKIHLFNIMSMIVLYNIATCCIAQTKDDRSGGYLQLQPHLVTKIFRVLTLAHQLIQDTLQSLYDTDMENEYDSIPIKYSTIYQIENKVLFAMKYVQEQQSVRLCPQTNTNSDDNPVDHEMLQYIENRIHEIQPLLLRYHELVAFLSCIGREIHTAACA
jgi:hypothetical protein